ncbi:MAG: glycosyltransferase family 4 protein [Thermoplasmata archaeon]
MPSWSIDFLATAPPEDITSGLSRTVWELAAALVVRGHRVRVLYPDPLVASREPYRGVGRIPVPLVGVSRRPFGRDIAIGHNASRLLDPAADVVVGTDEKAGAMALPRKSTAVFGMFAFDVSLHTFETLRPLEKRTGFRKKMGDWLDRGTLRRLEKGALERARFVLVGSELNQKLLMQYYRVPTERTEVVPIGVPDPIDVGSRADARLALHIPADVPVVAFIGRTPDRQGLPIALNTFRRVRVFFPGARFLVVGCVGASEPGVTNLGVVDEVTKGRVLRAADVFLFPAVYEGFGVAPREAMRYGLATIVSSHVPVDGLPVGTGIRVVNEDTPEAYASDLAELLADPALRRQMAVVGQHAADEFSYGRMAERFERVVQRARAS